MTTEEKLQHFLEFCIGDAKARSTKMMEEYTLALEKTFQEHQEDARRRADQQVALEEEKIKREMNKRLSIEQLNNRRALGQKQNELKEKLFVELRDMLERFMETEEYQSLLELQIKKALQFAGDAEVTVYIDPADESRLHLLSLEQSASVRVSEYSFLGGARAVIPSRRILIDNSFQTKLEEEKRDFQFNLSGDDNRVTEGGAHE